MRSGPVTGRCRPGRGWGLASAPLVAALAWPAGGAAAAQDRPQAPLDALAFLVGDWQAGRGQVADTGEAAAGGSRFTVEVGGHALLRRDHTELRDAAGKPRGSFDQLMLIYPEAGSIRADYTDGSHVIHYGQAEIVPGRSVTFTSPVRPGAPVFRLRYQLSAPSTLTVEFAMEPAPGAPFSPIATGTLTRSGR